MAKSFLVYSVASQLTLYLMSISDHYIFAYWLKFRPGIGYPILEYLTMDPGPLDDFMSFRFGSENLMLYPTVGGFVLFPFGFLIYQFFSLMSETVGAAAFTALSVGLVVKGLGNLRLTNVCQLGIVTSYPVIFALSRGNNELLQFGLGLILVGLVVERTSHNRILRWATSICLIEPVPMVIFFRGGTVRERLFFVSRVLLLVVTALIIFGTIVAPHNVLQYLLEIRDYGGPHSTTPYPGSSLFSTSIQSGIRVVHYVFGWNSPPLTQTPSNGISLGFVIFAVGGLVFSYFALSQKYQLVDRMILTSSCWLVCYSSSFDYRLVWLLIPLALLMGTLDEVLDGWRVAQVILIAFVCTPKVFIWWPELGGHHIGSLLNPIALVILICVTGKYGRNVCESELGITAKSGNVRNSLKRV